MISDQTLADLEALLPAVERYWQPSRQDNMFCILQVMIKMQNIDRLHPGTPQTKKAVARNDAMAKAMGFDRTCWMFAWNDRPERTKADIVERVQQAIDRAKEERSAEILL